MVTRVATETINGRPVSFKGFGPASGGSPLDAASPVVTLDKKIEGLLGWDDFGQVEITQVDPLPLRVLAMNIKVNF